MGKSIDYCLLLAFCELLVCVWFFYKHKLFLIGRISLFLHQKFIIFYFNKKIELFLFLDFGVSYGLDMFFDIWSTI